MAKPKVAKPNTVSKADVNSHQKRLNKLQRQVTAANRRNTRTINQLAETQTDQYEQAAEQLTILQAAALKTAAAEDETPESQVRGLQASAAITAQSQSDSVESKSIADYRARQQVDDYKRRQLVNAIMRNRQIT